MVLFFQSNELHWDRKTMSLKPIPVANEDMDESVVDEQCKEESESESGLSKEGKELGPMIDQIKNKISRQKIGKATKKISKVGV